MTPCSIRYSTGSLLLILLLSTIGFSAGSLHAASPDAEKQRVNFDELASALDKGMRTASVKSFAVADFLDSDGRDSELTWYLSGKLSDAMRKDVGNSAGLRVVSRATLADTKVTVDDFNSPEALARVGGVWGVAAIVGATVEVTPDHFVVRAIVRNVSDSVVVIIGVQSIPRDRFLDLLLPEGTDKETTHLKTIGVDGVVAPTCVYCPIPSYSDDARAARIQTAKVTLTVTVSTKGEAIKVVLDKNPGFGLGEKAIEDVSEWKFRPAMQNGKPVTVAVPVEVTFNLART
jgi:TonB family protein